MKNPLRHLIHTNPKGIAISGNLLILSVLFTAITFTHQGTDLSVATGLAAVLTGIGGVTICVLSIIVGPNGKT